jgi:hypothetical protein
MRGGIRTWRPSSASRIGALLQCSIRAAVQHHRLLKSPRIEGRSTMLPDAHRSAAELRNLARWYRDYAELAHNPVIWSSRLSTAEELEREALVAESSAAPSLLD